MHPNKNNNHHASLDSDHHPQLPQIKIHHPSSPRIHSPAVSAATPTSFARRRIGVAVDLSDESAYAVNWAVQHYLRPGDAVILVHVSPTSVLFGADWGATIPNTPTHPVSNNPVWEQSNDVSNDENSKKLEADFDAYTASKLGDLAKPLRDAQILYKIHIVKDHDMRERLCLEVERLGLSAVIMGSRGFGAVRRGSDGKLGSVSDYCVHHCVCPVVVVRHPDGDKDGGNAVVTTKVEEKGEPKIKTVPATQQEHKKED